MAPTFASSAAGIPFCTSAVDICRNSAYCPASTRSNAFLASTAGSWAGWAASRTERSGKICKARIDMTLLSYSGKKSSELCSDGQFRGLSHLDVQFQGRHRTGWKAPRRRRAGGERGFAGLEDARLILVDILPEVLGGKFK